MCINFLCVVVPLSLWCCLERMLCQAGELSWDHQILKKQNSRIPTREDSYLNHCGFTIMIFMWLLLSAVFVLCLGSLY